MSDRDTAATLDPNLVDDVEKMIRETAYMICDEQPDVPRPATLRDLDSFSMVQVLLELENTLETKLLERFEPFQGETFRDLAEFIVGLAQQEPDEPPQPQAQQALPAEPGEAAPVASAGHGMQGNGNVRG